MVDREDVVKTAQIGFTPPEGSDRYEPENISWNPRRAEGKISGLAVLLKDGRLLCRLTPAALELIEEGGSFRALTPEETKEIIITCEKDPSLPEH